MRRAAATVLLAILTTAGCGSASGGSTANPASSGSAPAASPTAPSKSATSVPTGLDAVRAWLNGGGQKQLDLISADLDGVKTGLGDPGSPQLVRACAKLTADAESLQLAKPMSDERAAGEWKLSLTYLQKAGTECTSGDYTAMSADLKIGIHHVAAVTDQVT